ncbi:hypothetical protein BKA69DRAFT_1122695 [Paraphysoderma sedebokerense]|nr:hypothetical protein BKA69DRAFT_1122695 [Paraphysoderma sedebokerense]
MSNQPNANALHLQIIHNEILSVISFMRRNAKFSSVSSQFSLTSFSTNWTSAWVWNQSSSINGHHQHARRLYDDSDDSDTDEETWRGNLQKTFKWVSGGGITVENEKPSTSKLSTPTETSLPGSPPVNNETTENTNIVPSQNDNTISEPTVSSSPNQSNVDPASLPKSSTSAASPNRSRLNNQQSSTQPQITPTEAKKYTRTPPISGSSLLQGFVELKKKLSSLRQDKPLHETITPLFLLTPFLRVIQSGDTTGPITGAALASVEKFIKLGIVAPASNNLESLPQVLSLLVHTVTHAKFEATDATSDEVVLWRILGLLKTLCASSLLNYLTDEAICEMIEMGLKLVRRTAEQTLIMITHVLFERLKTMDNTISIVRVKSHLIHTAAVPQETPPNLPNSEIKPGESSDTIQPADSANDSSVNATDFATETHQIQVLPDSPIQTTNTNTFVPFGLPSIRELVRVLNSIIDPNAVTTHTDSVRMLSLTLFLTALEAAGPTIAQFPELRSLIANETLRFLVLIIRSDFSTSGSSSPSYYSLTQNVSILATSYRLVTLIYGMMYRYIKPHIQLIFQTLLQHLELLASPSTPPSVNPVRAAPLPAESMEMRRVNSGRGISGNINIPWEVREAMLELFSSIVRTEGFLTNLWVNYDCDVYGANLVEDFFKFLSENAFPDYINPSSSILYIHCMDILSNVLKDMAEHCETDIPAELIAESKRFLEKKKKKEVLLEGAKKFNEDVKEGIKFLQGQGIVDDPLNPKSMAYFLKTTPDIHKKLLGEYIAKPKHLDILKEYIKLFRFDGKRIDEGMRDMLAAFRLPGEAQQIDRIMDCFAEAYFATKPEQIASRDAGYVLAFAIIMLNTDQHNPQVRKRMTYEGFANNLRGLNEKKNFDAEYLKAIYENIRDNEIIMPEEHEGEAGFTYTWKELVNRQEPNPAEQHLLQIRPAGFCDRDIFLTVWKTTLSAVLYVFETSEDEVSLQKSIKMFNYCARIASSHNIPEVLDTMIISLCKATTLLPDSTDELQLSLPEDEPESPTDDEAREKNRFRSVNALSVRFGHNFKAQIATIILFSLAAEYGNMIREGWINLLECIKTLFLHNMIPSSFLQVEDFIKQTIKIPRLTKSSNSLTSPQSRQANTSPSILSVFSQYLSLGSSSGYSSIDSRYTTPPTKEEYKCMVRTDECLNQCRLNDIFGDVKFLDDETLTYLLKALISVSMKPSENSERRMDHEKESGQTVTTPSQKGEMSKQPYNPSACYFLESVIYITIQNRDRVELIWPIVFEFISGMLKSAASCHTALIERAVVGLLRLSIRLVHKPEMMPNILKSLEIIQNLPNDVFDSISDSVMAGLLSLVQSDKSLKSGRQQWEVVTKFLFRTIAHPSASRFSYETTTFVVLEDGGSNISNNNFSECVELLIGFSTAAAKSSLATEIVKSPSRQKPSKQQFGSIERAVKSLEILYGMHHRIPHLIAQSGVSVQDAWSIYWLPLLSGLTQQCYHPVREIRQSAMSLLQRALLLPALTTTPTSEWISIVFNQVLFVLIGTLMKPEVYKLDVTGMDEARIRATTLTCKLWLQYLGGLKEWDGLNQLWEKLLVVLKPCFQEGASNYLHEAALESLKNMLLVMSSSGLFLKSSSQTSTEEPVYNDLWESTWKIIDPILPQLKNEMFPAKSKESEQQPEAINPEQSERVTDGDQDTLPGETDTVVNASSPVKPTGSQPQEKKENISPSGIIHSEMITI